VIIASDFTKQLLSDKSVSLEFDVSERGQYGRLLAYVYLENEMVNKTLLSKGYAQVATYPPNVAYVDDFTELKRTARENVVGFWGMESEKITTALSLTWSLCLHGLIT
jgi:micrococcal nuclease